jgi:hypothetical protein
METLESLLKTKVRTRNNLEFTPDFRVNVQEDGGIEIFHPPLAHTTADLTLNFVVKNELFTHKGYL